MHFTSYKFHRYQLIPVATLNSKVALTPRSGTLLRFEFDELCAGYADCFPWPELGDLELNLQLKHLRNGILTPLTQRSVYFARIDAEARSRGVSLFDGLEIPPSHALVTDFTSLSSEFIRRAAETGFRILKIKAGRNPKDEATTLLHLAASGVLAHSQIKLRLDFNSALNLRSFNDFLDAMGSALEYLDFIEDPIPFDALLWTTLQRTWRIRLALDRISESELGNIPPGCVSVLVIKPAIQNVTPMVQEARRLQTSILFTSYLDHPLGQLCAAWTAAKTQKDLAGSAGPAIESAGLLSQCAYVDHAATAFIGQSGSTMIPPTGAGFGMGEWLENLDWQEYK